MAGAIAARTHGDDYQARVFWREACRLFDRDSHVERVAFEHGAVKSFDDVAVFYGPGRHDEAGNSLVADYFQVKFHVNAAGALTADALMDPTFINATRVSLLERLRDAQQQYAPQGTEARFTLYTPWPIAPDDPLAKIYSQQDGRLDWHKLSRGGPQSRLGKLRAAWRTHLQLSSDDELRVVLQPFRITTGLTLQELQKNLNDKLCLAGLMQVDMRGHTNPYDELFRKLLQARQTSFTRTEIEQLAKRERLWHGQPVIAPAAKRVGIRSFQERGDHLTHETDALLCLLRHFEGRRARSAEVWEQEVYPELVTFLTGALPSPQQAQVELHTHASIAFAAGYCLHPKTGIECVIVQQTSGKRSLWCPDPHADPAAYATWEWTTQELRSTGSDVALALSVAKPTLPDVELFVRESLPNVGRILACTLPSGTRTTSVQDGQHAHILAEQLATHLKINRTVGERGGVLHIFAAGPNALLFFIGQLAHSFGRCVVYEYDFESNRPGAYTRGLSFPPVSTADC